MEQRRQTNIIIMPSMLILQSARAAAHWNNEATRLIQQGEYSKATANLTKAIITLREAVNTTTTAPTSSSSVSSSSSSCCMDPPPLVSSTTMSISSSTSNEEHEHEHEGTNSMMMDMETSASLSSTSCSSTTTSLLSFLTCCNKPEQESEERMDNVVYSPLSSSTSTTLGSSARQMMIAVEEDWYLCHAPLQVTSSEALISSPRCVEILSYSIIYNLGLCYHLAALSSTSTTGVSSSSLSPLSTLSTSQQLQRAVSFYYHAQRLLACAYSFNHPCMNVTMHTMILTNNMGHAYYVLNEEVVAKRCFQTLLIAIFQYPSMSLLSSSLSSSWRQESLQEQRHDDPEPILECFLSNIIQFLLCMGNGKHVAAPAA